jgi:glycosyltransferase involved in cell wall biosynthesis
LKICFATYAGVTITGGGPFVKIKDLKSSLEKKGIEIEIFDLWKAGENLSKYDLYHIFGGNFAVYDLARHLKANKIKYVVNPIIFSRHSFTTISIMNNLDKILKKIINGFRIDYGYTREICEWSELVLPNTKAEGDIISKGLGIPDNKLRIFHNGVSEKFLNGDPAIFEEKYSVKDFILSVGHFGPVRKNGLALVKALKNIDRTAVIIGNITDEGEGVKIKGEIKRNKNIIYVEGLQNDSSLLSSAYAACNTFVLASWYETPGRAALEAALAGAKIVITPYGGTKDYFEGMVEYVNPYSISSIRKGIEVTLNKPKGDKLKEHIKQNFLWNKIADEAINIYKEIVNQR